MSLRNFKVIRLSQCWADSMVDGAHGHPKAVTTQWLASPLQPGSPGPSHLQLPTEIQTQLKGNRARQHMVCCRGCTGTYITLRSLSNEENKWCFVACDRYINVNNFTSSCVQVSGYSAQCISTNRFTPSLLPSLGCSSSR